MCKTFKKILGKCHLTNMIIKLGNLVKTICSGNTMLLKISEENNKTNLYMLVQTKYILSILKIMFLNIFLKWEIS